MNLKLSQEAAAALVSLRASADFSVFLKWLKEHEAQAVNTCCRQDGVQLYRAQGRVEIFQEITKAVAEAPGVHAKFQQQR